MSGRPVSRSLRALGIQQSASVRGVAFATERALRQVLRHYFRYYNHTRLHSALGFRSPVDYESEAA
ncbi:MAG: IS3 family transposase [Gemmatimonadetes bacterium]|nr:IS3 family transposase [Gemmatimonadota bacterium]